MEFRILGPVGLWADGVELPLKGSKQRTMLAALLLAQERVLSDVRLGEMLWGKWRPKTYQAQIYTYVSRLRRHLEGGVRINRQGPGYSLRIGSAGYDFHEFQRLSRTGRVALEARQYHRAADLLHAALRLWRGPTLTDVTDLLSEAEGPSIEEARMEALECRIDAELALGRHEVVKSELVGLVAAHPLRERFRSQLMISLYRSDQQAYAFATYHEGARLLADELGVDPGPTLRGAYHAILTDDPDLTSIEPRAEGPVTTTTTTRPALLAPGTPDFCGRAGEIASLSRLLEPGRSGPSGQPAVAVITGMPGVGKTTLALRAAGMFREEYSDGQLFVDLRGSSDAPLSPAEALGTTLTMLGATGVPQSLDERLRLYRSILADRRMIVLLDDVADDDQVCPLLTNSPRCRVIITTRHNLMTLEGQRALRLEPFERTEALDLLEQIIGADRLAGDLAAAGRIVELCGALPLAVRVAGARLAAKPHWPLTRVAGRLTGEDARLDELRLGNLDVRTRLLSGYLLLDGEARDALCRLALLDAEAFPHAVASTVLHLSDAEGERLTEHLLDHHMLQLAGVDRHGRQMYRLHELVRLLGRELADAEAKALARGVPISC